MFVDEDAAGVAVDVTAIVQAIPRQVELRQRGLHQVLRTVLVTGEEMGEPVQPGLAGNQPRLESVLPGFGATTSALTPLHASLIQTVARI